MPKAARTTKAGRSSRVASSRRVGPGNTKPSGVKRNEKGQWLPGTESPNPAGAPKRGESFAEIVREIGNMTGEQLAEQFAIFAKDARVLGPTRVKDAFIVKAFLAFMRDPTGSMFNAITDRAEGKPVSHIEVEGLVKGYSGVSPDDWDSAPQ
jgi:hypothetical protein